MKMLRVEMFLPNEPADPRFRLTEEVSREAGGSTATQGYGRWVDEDGELVREPVVTLLFFCDDTLENRLWIETLARRYKREAEQEAVLYVLDGTDSILLED